MDLNSLMSRGDVQQQDAPEAQAEHSAAPQAGVKEDAKALALALAGMMAIFYLLHITERWAVKI